MSKPTYTNDPLPSQLIFPQMETATTYVRVMPAPFDLEASSLADLVAAMQWCKWEIKTWKKIVKDNVNVGEGTEQSEDDKNALFATEQFLEDIDNEIAERFKHVWARYQI